MIGLIGGRYRSNGSGASMIEFGSEAPAPEVHRLRALAALRCVSAILCNPPAAPVARPLSDPDQQARYRFHTGDAAAGGSITEAIDGKL